MATKQPCCRGHELFEPERTCMVLSFKAGACRHFSPLAVQGVTVTMYGTSKLPVPAHRQLPLPEPEHDIVGNIQPAVRSRYNASSMEAAPWGASALDLLCTCSIGALNGQTACMTCPALGHAVQGARGNVKHVNDHSEQRKPKCPPPPPSLPSACLLATASAELMLSCIHRQAAAMVED